MRRRYFAAFILAMIVSLALAAQTSARPAAAATERAQVPAVAQAQNAYLYSHWKFSGKAPGYWNVDQQMRVKKRSTATYWAMDWSWVGASQGGYVGLQTNGGRFDGSTGDTAIFSLWDATAAKGPHCGAFGGEGSGLSCRLPYKISTSTYYRYRIWRLTADSAGQWWGAWIENIKTHADTYLGSIRVAAGDTQMSAPLNFVEYFGQAVACNKVPKSEVVWTQPAANSLGGGRYQYGSHYSGMDIGACTTGKAVPVNLGWTKGVDVVLG
jgi:Domain of unknown function (DUF3472)